MVTVIVGTDLTCASSVWQCESFWWLWLVVACHQAFHVCSSRCHRSICCMWICDLYDVFVFPTGGRLSPRFALYVVLFFVCCSLRASNQSVPSLLSPCLAWITARRQNWLCDGGPGDYVRLRGRLHGGEVFRWTRTRWRSADREQEDLIAKIEGLWVQNQDPVNSDWSCEMQVHSKRAGNASAKEDHAERWVKMTRWVSWQSFSRQVSMSGARKEARMQWPSDFYSTCKQVCMLSSTFRCVFELSARKHSCSCLRLCKYYLSVVVEEWTC